jgi:twitching motility two-component system response regulator PilG
MKLEFESNPVSLPYVDQEDVNEMISDVSSPEVNLMLRDGIKAAQEGERTEARVLLLRVTEADPKNENAWLWLASISEYPEELLVFLKNVLNINPNNERAIEWAKATEALMAKTFVQRGIDASKNDQKSIAKQCFLQALVHDNKSELAWLWLASVTDSAEEKISHLQKVLNINPDNENALSSLKNARVQMGKALMPMANDAAISGQREKALKLLDEILNDAPDFEDAWMLKAHLAESFEEKIAYFEQVLEVNSENQVAKANLESLQLIVGKSKEQDKSDQFEESADQQMEAAEEESADQQMEAVEEESADQQMEAVEEESADQQMEAAEEESVQLEMDKEQEKYKLNDDPVESFEDQSADFESEYHQDEVVREGEQIPDLKEEEESAKFEELQVDTVPEDAFEQEESVQSSVEESSQEFEEAVQDENESLEVRSEEENEEKLSENESEHMMVEEELESENPEPADEDPQFEEELFEDYYAENVPIIEPESSLEFAGHENDSNPQEVGVYFENPESKVESQTFEEQTEEEPVFNEEESPGSEVDLAENDFSDDVNQAYSEQFEYADDQAQLNYQTEETAEPDYSVYQEVEADNSPDTKEYSDELNLENDNNAEFETAKEADKEAEISEPATAQMSEQVPEKAAERHSELLDCPFCYEQNEHQSFTCSSCQTVLSLSDLEILLSQTSANQEKIESSVAQMEADKKARGVDIEELKHMGIGYINLKKYRKGLEYLQKAARQDPNDIILNSQIDALAIRISEIEKKEKDFKAQPKSKTILIVDDSPTVRKLISGKLEKSGHNAICAVDGMDALAKINETVPDLILLDITMPRMDGYQVCKLIRGNEATQDVPVIMISGKDGFFDKVRGKMAGTNNYITKPFGPETLMKTVNEYIS